MTNDSGFLTSHQSLSNYSTLANTIKSLSISGKTITYTKGDDTTGTLTTQDNNTWTAMVGATSSSNGSVGYVNAVPPKDGYNTKYLRADGTWQVPPDHTYTVNNATLTIQKNGTTVKTFTANASSDVTCNITVPTKTSELTNNSGFLTSHQDLSGYVPKNGGAVITGSTLGRTVDNNEFRIDGGTGWDKGASLSLSGKDRPDLSLAGAVILRASDGSQSKAMTLYPDGTFMLDNKNIAMAEDVIPRIGGEVFDASIYARNIDNSEVIFYGGRYGGGGNIFLAGKDNPGITGGVVGIRPDNSTNMHNMWFSPDGSLSWDGQPIQYG